MMDASNAFSPWTASYSEPLHERVGSRVLIGQVSASFGEALACYDVTEEHPQHSNRKILNQPQSKVTRQQTVLPYDDDGFFFLVCGPIIKSDLAAMT